MRLATPRLTMREMTRADAPFILSLLNDPGFIANIADRGVRTETQAARYIADRFLASYARNGFGFHLVAKGDEPIGICGFVAREGLPAPDLGFAYLAAHVGRGYGREAGEAVLAHGRDRLGLDPILAITRPDNEASIGLLGALGFVGEGIVDLPGIVGPSRLFRYSSPKRAPAEQPESHGILTRGG